MEKLNQDWDKVMGLYFYDLQNIIESYSRILEERDKAEKKQAKEQGYDPSTANPKNMMDSAKGMMPKTPSFPNFSFPKL